MLSEGNKTGSELDRKESGEEVMSGRDLDKVVAEKIMGWTEIVDKLYLGTIRMVGIPPDERLFKSFDGLYAIPNYSTSLSDAWEVVEEIMKRKDQFILNKGKYNEHEVDVFDISYRGKDCFASLVYGYAGQIFAIVKGETAPHAICLVALDAMKVITT